MKNYLVQFEKSEQITEDQWRIARPSLTVQLNATLEDILKWAVFKNGGKLPNTVEIREVETLTQ